MQPSTTATLDVRALGSGKTPTTLYHAATVVMRVLVRNVGAGLLFIATEPDAVNPQLPPQTATYRLPSGHSEVFVVTAKAGLYAVCIGAGGKASVAASEALPLDILRS